MKAETRVRVLGVVAVSWLCACGADRSGLAPDEGAAGRRSVAGAAGTGGTGPAESTTSGGGTGGNGAGAGATDAGAAGAPDAAAGGAAGAIDGGSLTIATAAGCSKDGWCWSTPAPQGNPLYSIWGSGANDVWAVGESGSIIHWDGKVWTLVPSGEHGALRGVWTAGARDAWAVGDYAAIVHWDGTAWSRPPGVPAMGFHWRAVWGTRANDVWIVGVDEAVSTPEGSGGAMMHWDGAAWTTYRGPQSLGALWGTGPDDVWGLGDAHGLFHWDGKAWTTASDGELPQIGTALWGSSSSDSWLTGRSASRPSHWNGLTVAVDPDMADDIDGLWGSGANDVWAVGDASPDWFGDGGEILHWDGLAWKKMPSTGASHLYGIWGSRSDDVWAVGYAGDIVHWDGRTWSAPVGPPRLTLFSVWGSGPDDVWAFGDDSTGLGALRWNGQAWAKTEVLGAAAIGGSATAYSAPYAAWGSGSDDIWIGAEQFEPIGNTGSSTARSYFVHWDGRRWSLDASLDANVAGSMHINAIWGSGPKDVWAVGMVDGDATQSGAAVHWDGTRWSSVTSLSPIDLADVFGSVWSSGPNDVWIGGNTAVHHWDGVSWSRPLSAQEGGGGFLVGGSGPADVWAVSSASDGPAVASRWNGLVWQPGLAPNIDFPISFVAISPTNAWVRGEETITHWDGTTWTLSDAGTNFFSSNLWWDGKELWAGAMRGLVRHP